MKVFLEMHYLEIRVRKELERKKGGNLYADGEQKISIKRSRKIRAVGEMGDGINTRDQIQYCTVSISNTIASTGNKWP